MKLLSANKYKNRILWAKNLFSENKMQIYERSKKKKNYASSLKIKPNFQSETIIAKLLVNRFMCFLFFMLENKLVMELLR